MPKVARILKLRGDEDIIKYNLMYYHNIGVDCQYIMLHYPSYELLQIIDSLSDKINLKLLYHDKEGSGFNPVNEEYLRVLTDVAQLDGFQWIIGSDADEFLFIKDNKNIKEFLSDYDNYSNCNMLFSWVNYYLSVFDSEKPFYEIMQTRRHTVMPWTKAVGKFDKSDMYFCQGLHHVVNSDIDISIDNSRAYYGHFPHRSKKQFVFKNIIQALKFKDWRLDKLKEDPLYFEHLFDLKALSGFWPLTFDNENDMDNSDFIQEPLEQKFKDLML